MQDKTLLTTGILGTGIAAICCFTPALAILLGTVELTAWLAWLDFILLPAFALFLGITVYALVKRKRTVGSTNG